MHVEIRNVPFCLLVGHVGDTNYGCNKLVWCFLISLHREFLSILSSLYPKMVTLYSQKIIKNVPFRLLVSHVWHTNKGSCHEEINENAWLQFSLVLFRSITQRLRQIFSYLLTQNAHIWIPKSLQNCSLLFSSYFMNNFF